MNKRQTVCCGASFHEANADKHARSSMAAATASRAENQQAPRAAQDEEVQSGATDLDVIAKHGITKTDINKFKVDPSCCQTHVPLALRTGARLSAVGLDCQCARGRIAGLSNSWTHLPAMFALITLLTPSSSCRMPASAPSTASP